MKRLILFVGGLFFIIIVFFGRNFILQEFNNFYYYSPCDKPIYYKIGSVDARFNISKDRLFLLLSSAADIWNKTEEKNLFLYGAKTRSITVNFVFDIRQALRSQIETLKGQVQEKQTALNPEIAQYQKDVENFKNNLANLNNEIETWNKQGGAPPNIYNQLLTEQKNLQTEAGRLNTEASRLNQSTALFNADVSKLNQTVNVFNQTLVGKPEEGLYDNQQNAISIFFLTDQNEIIHTLAHEMGHALGLDHVDNKNSIMYPFTNNLITPTVEDINELKKICTKKSLPELFIQKLNLLLQSFQTKPTVMK